MQLFSVFSCLLASLTLVGAASSGGKKFNDVTLNIVNAVLALDGFTRSKLNLYFTMCVMLIFPSGTVVADGT
jgi:hypothetical protein